MILVSLRYLLTWVYFYFHVGLSSTSSIKPRPTFWPSYRFFNQNWWRCKNKTSVYLNSIWINFYRLWWPIRKTSLRCGWHVLKLSPTLSHQHHSRKREIIIYLCRSQRRSRQEQCRRTRIASWRKPFPIRLKRIGLTSGLFCGLKFY